LLTTLHIVEPKPPKPVQPSPVQPQPQPNLADNSAEIERKRKRYREEVVVRDPRDNKGYSQYQLDHVVSADLYKFLMMGSTFVPTIRSLIDPRIK